MIRNISFTSLSCHVLAVGALACWLVFPSSVLAQTGSGLPEGGARTSATHDFVDLIGAGDGGVNAITDYVLFPYGPSGGNPGGFAIGDRGTGGRPFATVNNAPAGSMAIDTSGVGIGLNGISQHPTAQLHVAGGGPSDAFSQARILVENRSTTAAVRNLFALQNNGGVSIEIDDTGASGSKFALVNDFGSLDFRDNSITGTSVLPFSIITGTPNNACILAANGVGMGISAPTSALHVFADGTGGSFSSTITSEVKSPAPTQNRTMLNLVNNGGAFMTFTDSSQPGGSTWFFSNSNDELQLRKGGGGVSPAIRIKPSGEFAFVANQGNRFQIFPNGDVKPGTGGSYLTPSDRNLKENFETLDNQQILDKLVELPVTSWNYKDDDGSRRHVGPMAQDFYAAFGLGNDDKTICEMDKDGIAFAAIKGLNQKVESKNAEIAKLNESLQAQSKQLQQQSDLIEDQTVMIEELARRLESLEVQLAPQNK